MKLYQAIMLAIGAVVIGGAFAHQQRDAMRTAMESRPWEAELPVKHPLVRDLPYFDETAGRFRIPPPPGFTEEEYDVALTQLVTEERQREGNRLPGEPTLEERHRALNRSRLTPSQLADLEYFEKRESAPAASPAPGAFSRENPWFWPNVFLVLGWVHCAGWAAYAVWLVVRRSHGAVVG